MNVWTILKNVTRHPLNENQKAVAVKRFLWWQIRSRLNSSPLIYPFIGDTKLIVKKGMTGATGNIYNGLHEFHDMAFLLHYLHEDDLFVDVGANMGVYTILASGHKKSRTISVEPIPSTFNHFLNNINVNHLSDKVDALNIGLGGADGKLFFTKDFDTVNHVVAESDGGANTIEVEVKTLDHVLNGKSPSLLKIDVEGFETEVLKGAAQTLKNNRLEAIIIELNGSGTRYGYDEMCIHELLLSEQFQPYTYDPFSRTLTAVGTFGKHNTIYIRNIESVKERIKNAPSFEVFGHVL